jgi:DNA-directed RNA polymerase specialized sigma subunit
MDNKSMKELVDEMKSIKKLLILQLLRADVSQKHIASMLEVSEATMSRMIPKGASGKKPKIAQKAKELEIGALGDE